MKDEIASVVQETAWKRFNERAMTNKNDLHASLEKHRIEHQLLGYIL